MTSPTLRGTVIPRAVIFCASAAAVLSVAACSSGGTVAGTAVDAASASGAKTAANGSGSDSGSGASSDDTTTAAATADPSTLLLTTADVPAGFQVTPAEANKAGSDMVAELGKSAKITPEGCRPTSLSSTTDANAKIFGGFTPDGVTMVEAVQVGGADIDKATKTARSKCSTMTLDSNVSGQQIHSVNTSSVFDLPHNEADKSVGIKMTSTATIAGTEVTTTSLLAIAQVGGYSVVTSVGGTRSAPSQSTFDDFTTKAIAKVAAAS